MQPRTIHEKSAIFLNNSAPFDAFNQYPFYHIHRESVLPQIPDATASLLINVAVYWIFSVIYYCLDLSGFRWLEKYRVQESDEVKKRNLVTRGQVVRLVAFQQCIQMALGTAWFMLVPAVASSSKNYPHELRVISVKIANILLTVVGEQRGRDVFQHYGPSLTYATYWWLIPIWQFLFAVYVSFLIYPFYVRLLNPRGLQSMSRHISVFPPPLTP